MHKLSNQMGSSHLIYENTSQTGKVRKSNEDRLKICNVDDGLLAILCDGLGGSSGGEVAANLCIETITEYFSNTSGTDVLQKISNAMVTANDVIYDESHKNDQLFNMSTTLEIVLIQNSTIFWGHIGDSRIYSYKNRKLKQITKDHSLVQKLVDEGQLSVAQAEVFPNKNVIVKAIGSSEKIMPDVSKVRFQGSGRQKILMCSDGVHGVVSHDELEDILSENKLTDSKKKLINLIERRGSPDNYSFIIISSE
jgi:PPM family protein phosphatase